MIAHIQTAGCVITPALRSSGKFFSCCQYSIERGENILKNKKWLLSILILITIGLICVPKGSPAADSTVPIKVFHHSKEMAVIKNQERDSDSLFVQTIINGSRLYQKINRNDVLAVNENEKEPIVIEVDRGLRLVDLKYDYLLYQYDGSIPKRESDLRHPFYPTREAAFQKKDGKYMTYLPNDRDYMLFLSSQTYLAYVYTATLKGNGGTFIYNFMIPRAYFTYDTESLQDN